MLTPTPISNMFKEKKPSLTLLHVSCVRVFTIPVASSLVYQQVKKRLIQLLWLN